MEHYNVPDTTTIPIVPPTETRYYLSDNYEISDGGLWNKRYYYYIGGNAYDAKAVLYMTHDTCRIYQMYRDNVGSIALYASRQDNFRLYYNPWGVRTKGQNGQQYSPGSVHGPKFIRSYTGHEELPWFGLLNANARLYDPYMGRFLSPDPLLAISGNPLHFNPYVYTNNNPLRYVDQNGEFFITIVTAIGNTIANLISHGFNFKNYYWKKTINAWKIDKGLFQGNVEQIISKLTWGLPQTVIGNVFAHGYNIASNISVNTGYGMVTIGGATGSSNREKAFTLSNYSFGPNNYKPDFRDNLFVHEYGHFLQSNRWGIGYIPCIAMPSLLSAFLAKNHKKSWYEINASKLSMNYFDKNYGPNSSYAIGKDVRWIFNKNIFMEGRYNYKGLFDYVNPRTNDSTKDKGNYTSMDKVYFHWFDFIPFL